jgi:nitrite reductase/ring-hydroxylating ferredoxin subunit
MQRDVREGQVMRIDAGGRPLLLWRRQGRLFAIDAICSHAGGRLEDGEIRDGCVICPVHGAIFDLMTGKASPETDWAADLDSFPVTVDNDVIFVELDLNAAAAPTLLSGDACPWSGAREGFDYNPTAPGQELEHHPHFFLRGLKQLELEWEVGRLGG